MRIVMCGVCKEQSRNGQDHPECAAAKNEQLLLDIQKGLDSGTVTIANKGLARRIHEGLFMSLEDFFRLREEKRSLLHEKERWEKSLAKHLAESRKEWEKKHPDPNPVRFGSSL